MSLGENVVFEANEGRVKESLKGDPIIYKVEKVS